MCSSDNNVVADHTENWLFAYLVLLIVFFVYVVVRPPSEGNKMNVRSPLS